MMSNEIPNGASSDHASTVGAGPGADDVVGRSRRGSVIVDKQKAPRKTSGHMATLTGLEPATSAVTGRRANQLRHRAVVPPTGFEPVLPP